MKVMIIKCSKKEFWYEKKIGKIYRAEEETAKEYIVTTKDAGGKFGYVLKEDCEVIG